MIYQSNVELLGDFPSFTQQEIREEQSQARVPVEEAVTGGPIHKAFVEHLPNEWRDDPSVEIFSRVLYLKQGWYPLTPHFHFDWGNRSHANRIQTLMVCLGDASLTEFILGPLEVLSEPGTVDQRVPWDSLVQEGLSRGELESWRIEPGKMILFDNQTLHRARPATKSGWRLLLRAIRGFSDSGDRNGGGSYGNPGRFATCRNGYVPETEEERARYRVYQD